jgi:hypothetical protein
MAIPYIDVYDAFLLSLVTLHTIERYHFVLLHTYKLVPLFEGGRELKSAFYATNRQ